MTLSDSRLAHRQCDVGVASSQTGLPRLPGVPFQRAVPITPADRDGCAYRLLPHPAWAFPYW